MKRDGKRFNRRARKLKQKSEPSRTGSKWLGHKRPATPQSKSENKRAPRGATVVGVIHHHRDGFAFVKPIVGQEAEDLFIPPDEVAKTVDQDQVLVEVGPGRGGRTMGRVLEVLTRTRQLVVGTYREQGKHAWVEPREAKLGRVTVPKTQLARPGDVVKVRLGVGKSLVQGSADLTGEVAGSLGTTADHSLEVLSVAYAKGFHDEFPPEVMDEADAIAIEVSAADARSERRKDVRDLPLLTIDGEDARDFDDAVYCEPRAGGWRLLVAIADVSHYVQEGTALDAEALRRATSVYLPGRVLPMLPERLSNGICSLKPEVDRLCLVADLHIDAQGVTQRSELYPAVMRSVARCTYTEVHQVLLGEAVAGRTQFKKHFSHLLAVSTALRAMRIARGAIDFDLPELKVELNDEGLPARLVQRERLDSHRLIEECMLAANEAVARFFREQQLPTVNRFHGEPDEDRLSMFLNLLGAYGIAPPHGELTSFSLNQVLQKLVGHPEQRALHQLALRSMMQAVYSSRQAGHYGLGAEDYLHFTSPIRRYPDLLVHRLLKAVWGRSNKRPGAKQLAKDEERLEELAVQCSERERAAMQVEREVNQLYSCLLLQDRIGETHDGTVCGLSENGFFVQLAELWVEGFVRGESVFPSFEFEQSTYRLEFANGLTVKVGMPCRVTVENVNFDRKQIDFRLEELEGFRARTAPEKRNRPFRSGDRGGRFGPPPSRNKAESRKERRPAPPPVPVAKKEPKASTDEMRGGFDARAVLDRLWTERGGKKKR